MKTYLPWEIFMQTDFCLRLQFVCSVCSVCLYVCVILACFQVLNSRIQSNGLTSTMTYLPQTDSELITLACWASNVVGRQTAPCLVHILPASKYCRKLLVNPPPLSLPAPPQSALACQKMHPPCVQFKQDAVGVLASWWCPCRSKSYLLCTPKDLLT